MKSRIIFFFFVNIIIFSLSGTTSFAQTFTVEVQIKNQPNTTIVFGSIKGDDFTPIDSTTINQSFGKIKFDFPENAHAGVYRINFGKTAAAKILNEPPQLLDFIFDNENLVFDTDYKAPLESLKVIQSKENTVWFDFLARDNIIRQNVAMVEKEIDSNRKNGDSAKIVDLANEYNQLQMERDMFVAQTAEESRGLFVSQMIKNLRVPIFDGYLTEEERKASFKKEFFNALSFNNPDLINSAIYTDNLFTYLVSYNQYNYTQKQREEEYIKALDIIVPNINHNREVYEFLMAYLVHGFNVLNMDNIINYISKEYNFPR